MPILGWQMGPNKNRNKKLSEHWLQMKVNVASSLFLSVDWKRKNKFKAASVVSNGKNGSMSMSIQYERRNAIMFTETSQLLQRNWLLKLVQTGISHSVNDSHSLITVNGSISSLLVIVWNIQFNNTISCHQSCISFRLIWCWHVPVF